jgi:dipeptidase E
LKLYLTSYRIPSPNALFNLLEKKPGNIRTAVIPNAKDYYAERARNFKIGETNQYLSNLGFQPETVDLREYRDSEKLKQALESFDFIWVSGGNTFCLRHEMKESGFEKIIKSVLAKGVVYGGESAGALVAGSSLKGIESADEPAFAESVIDNGLKLVPFYILPHAGNAMFEQSNMEVREQHANDPNLIELTDSEALVIDGEEMEKIEQEL